MELVITHDRPIVMTETQKWELEDIQRMCIEHDWYTRGTCADYEALMDLVRSLEPTPANIYRVAQDISNHSEDVKGSADPMLIMFHIANDVVMRTFEI